MHIDPNMLEEMECIDDGAYEKLDKRGTQEPIPSDLTAYLTPTQFRSLSHLDGFGWQLAFIRRPLFEDPLVVLSSPEGKQYAILEIDGSLNLEPIIRVRSVKAA